MTRLAPLISGFLRDHMPRQRGCSPHSCETYAHSFRLLFAFVAKRTGTKPSQLHVEQLDAALILDFLTHLEQERGNRAVTRNLPHRPRADRQDRSSGVDVHRHRKSQVDPTRFNPSDNASIEANHTEFGEVVRSGQM
jgi:hypothetical protein